MSRYRIAESYRRDLVNAKPGDGCEGKDERKERRASRLSARRGTRRK
jgi:hypothetical protein